MMDLDFSHAQLPALAPLHHSFAENEVEAQIKALFSDLFKQHLAMDVFDANVAGMAHLGRFERLRRSINHDGLVLIQNDGQQAATRYLYRAWQARNRNGRGLHFLRTYLQMLYPNQWAVEPLWQHKNQPYPQQLHPRPEEGVAKRLFAWFFSSSCLCSSCKINEMRFRAQCNDKHSDPFATPSLEKELCGQNEENILSIYDITILIAKCLRVRIEIVS